MRVETRRGESFRQRPNAAILCTLDRCYQAGVQCYQQQSTAAASDQTTNDIKWAKVDFKTTRASEDTGLGMCARRWPTAAHTRGRRRRRVTMSRLSQAAASEVPDAGGNRDLPGGKQLGKKVNS